jgi:hypothetical protein
MTTFCLYRAFVKVLLHGLAGTQKKKPRMRLERDTLALAAFVSRTQAEAQIGANRGKSYTTGYVVST